MLKKQKKHVLGIFTKVLRFGRTHGSMFHLKWRICANYRCIRHLIWRQCVALIRVVISDGANVLGNFFCFLFLKHILIEQSK